MPYKSIQSLPKGVKSSLPAHAKEIYRKSFNASLKNYGDERAAKIAWAAVKTKYSKGKTGTWKKKK